jgi:hypothetical protein
VDISPSPGGSGGGDVMDPVTGGPPSGPLGLDLRGRVLMGRPCVSVYDNEFVRGVHEIENREQHKEA